MLQVEQAKEGEKFKKIITQCIPILPEGLRAALESLLWNEEHINLVTKIIVGEDGNIRGYVESFIRKLLQDKNCDPEIVVALAGLGVSQNMLIKIVWWLKDEYSLENAIETAKFFKLPDEIFEDIMEKCLERGLLHDSVLGKSIWKVKVLSISETEECVKKMLQSRYLKEWRPDGYETIVRRDNDVSKLKRRELNFLRKYYVKTGRYLDALCVAKIQKNFLLAKEVDTLFRMMLVRLKEGVCDIFDCIEVAKMDMSSRLVKELVLNYLLPSAIEMTEKYGDEYFGILSDTVKLLEPGTLSEDDVDPYVSAMMSVGRYEIALDISIIGISNGMAEKLLDSIAEGVGREEINPFVGRMLEKIFNACGMYGLSNRTARKFYDVFYEGVFLCSGKKEKDSMAVIEESIVLIPPVPYKGKLN